MADVAHALQRKVERYGHHERNYTKRTSVPPVVILTVIEQEHYFNQQSRPEHAAQPVETYQRQRFMKRKSWVSTYTISAMKSIAPVIAQCMAYQLWNIYVRWTVIQDDRLMSPRTIQ